MRKRGHIWQFSLSSSHSPFSSDFGRYQLLTFGSSAAKWFVHQFVVILFISAVWC